MIVFIIYIVGYIVAYYTVRHWTNKMNPSDPWSYHDVLINGAFSLLSWLWLVFASLIYLKEMGYFDPKKWGKPPKWL